jgi:hypothetical protein
MNTNQIYGYLECFLQKFKCTFSVLPCDLLDGFKVEQYPLYLVVNTARSSHPGLHWVTLFRQRKKSPLLFLDSYGFDIQNYDQNFSTFARQLNVKVISGKRRLQSWTSNVCGHYAINFVYELSKSNGCIDSVYHQFSSDPIRNDRLVRKLVSKKICKLTYVFPTKIQCCNKFCENC